MILTNNENKRFTREAREEYEKAYEALNELFISSLKKDYTMEEFNFIITSAINELFLDYRIGVKKYP